MSGADLEPGKTIERSFKYKVREEDCGFQRISDRVAQAAPSLQSRILRSTGCRLRVHEEHDTQFLGFCPERIELAIREFLAFNTAADRGATHSEFLDGLFQLVGS